MLAILICACFPLVKAVNILQYLSVPLLISDLFNNQAASTNGSFGDFDGSGGSYDGSILPTGSWAYDGIIYELPASWGGSVSDNVIAEGQVIELSKPTIIHELHLLYAGDGSDKAFNFNLTYADNTTEQFQLAAKSWGDSPGAVLTPFRFISNGSDVDWNSTTIQQWSTSLPSRNALTSITLPQSGATSRLHLFAISMTPSVVDASHDAGPLLSVRRARFTTRWESVGGKRAQAVEVTLDNLLPINAFSENTSITNPITIELSGTQLRTVKPAVINRLVASDRVRVDVLVADGASGNATVTVKDHTGNTLGQSDGWLVTPLPGVWSNDPSLLLTHETPTWWNEAKYGIFIHWGIYSYPAWAPPQQYAEWYDWDLHNPSNSSSPTWEHHLQTYGPDVVYDDFIVNFTASKFNASSWVDLFDRAGAKYFVLVTKHHDGYALFDSGNTTHRASVYLGPGRDLVDELFTVAKKEKPNLHRGTYYSLPEWFNPDFAKYGFAEWPGGLAHNAFNASELEPYTGRLNISDYLQDLQLPQMLLLAQKYDTEIMWCDIGGPNMTLEFEAQFYNHAQAHGKQVTINNRCGVPQSDFDTPEYTKFNAIQTRKWETSEGMDPFSYGLNSATNASQYKNATTIVQSLVDIVSKNGNFLLDIGPNAEGEIIEAMSNNLLAAGEWLANSGDCVYATDYWFKGSQSWNANSTFDIRFLTTPTSFCVVSFTKPQLNTSASSSTLTVTERTPILPGDKIFYLGNGGDGEEVQWNVDSNAGLLTITIPASTNLEPAGGAEAWAFQVQYQTKH